MFKFLPLAWTLALLLPATSASAQTRATPTKEQMGALCASIYAQDSKPKVESEFIRFEFEELMLRMAGAIDANNVVKPKDEAYALVRKWWLANRENCRCPGYVGSLGSNKNVGKFATGNGFTVPLRTFMKRWKLDLDFKDSADGKTIYQFLVDEKDRLLTERPLNRDKIMEYDALAREVKAYVENYTNPDAPK
jgi:hypothetical protein